MFLEKSLQELEEIGVTSIPIYKPEELLEIQSLFRETLRNFPEYHRFKPNESDEPNEPDLNILGEPIVYVLGGFASLGNPSSFHNPLVRKIRQNASSKANIFFRELCSKRKWEDYSLQCLPDRMMYRRKGQKPTAEAWHRDMQPKNRLCEGDDIFGGWINLDSEPQYFSYIPKSHRIRYDLKDDLKAEVNNEKLKGGEMLALGVASGFATLKEEITDEEKRKKLISTKQSFIVEAGCMVIFPQYILHEVVAKPAPRTMYRLFTGWRLTRKNEMLALESDFKSQASFRLPGGMRPAMYAQQHLINFKQKRFNLGVGSNKNLLEWSDETFKSVCIEEKKGKEGKYKLVYRFLPSLRELNLPLYEGYNEEEMKIYRGVKM